MPVRVLYSVRRVYIPIYLPAYPGSAVAALVLVTEYVFNTGTI